MYLFNYASKNAERGERSEPREAYAALLDFWTSWGLPGASFFLLGRQLGRHLQQPWSQMTPVPLRFPSQSSIEPHFPPKINPKSNFSYVDVICNSHGRR